MDGLWSTPIGDALPGPRGGGRRHKWDSPILIPNRFDPSKYSRDSTVPNPRDSRHGAFVALPKWRRRRLFRFLIRLCVLSVVLGGVLVAVWRQTEIRRMVFDATLELGIGRCELYLDRKRDLVDWKCYRR